jgi:hypothetical protein
MAASVDNLVGHDCQPPAPEFPVITEAVKLTLKPGDVLVLKVDCRLPVDVHDNIKRWLAEQLPPGIHTLVLERGMSLQVVERAGEEGKW